MSKRKNVTRNFYSICILTRRIFSLPDTLTCKPMDSMQNLASMIFLFVTIAQCSMFVADVGRMRMARAIAGTGS